LRTVKSDILNPFGNVSERQLISNACVSKCSLLLEDGIYLPLLKGEEGKIQSRVISVTDDIDDQLFRIFGQKVRIVSRKTFSNGIICISTDCRECLFKKGFHKRNTQKIYFYDTYCVRKCWDSDCKHFKQYYSYKSNDCDWKRGEELLIACNKWVSEKFQNFKAAEGRLYFQKDSIYYFWDNKVILSIRYNVEPPKCTYYGGDVPFSKNIKGLAGVCHSFYSTIKLYPIEVDADAVKSEWKLLGVSEFHVDEGVGDVDLTFVSQDVPNSVTVIISPPGTSKTEGVRKTLHFNGDVATNAILLADNIASRYDVSFYRTNGWGPRTKVDLTNEPKSVVFVVNSIEKVMDRPIKEFFLDESSAVLTSLAGKTMSRDGAQVLEHLETLITRTPRVIVASADVTAGLEGAWLKSLGKSIRVVYQPNHRKSDKTKCLELKSDRQMWDIYVRILKYNNSNRPPIRVFFPSNTKAVVKRAEHLCRKYWPNGRSIFVYRDSTGLPKDFISDPNKTWIDYDIIGISPKLKVGVSFTVPDHFDATILFACSGTTSSNDAIQMMKRVRPDVKALFVRIQYQGKEKKRESLEEETLEALVTFTTEHRIRRVLPPFKPNEKFESLCGIINEMRGQDREKYVHNIRNALRVRNMTIQLGGIQENETLHLYDGVDLLPLPSGTDMKTPSAKDDQIQAILDADDLVPQDAYKLYEQSKVRALSNDEQNQLERYQIRNEYRKGGPLEFAELVKMHVKKNFREKMKQLHLYMSPMHQAAGLDESQFSFLRPLERENFMIQRQRAHEMTALLPGFNNNFATYELKREHLSDGNILEQQTLLGMGKSTAQDPILRAVGNFNKLFESMGLPKLVSCESSRPRKKGSRPRVTVAWKFQNDGSVGLFYANVPKPMGKHSVILENPEIFNDQVRGQDDSIYPLVPIARDLVGVIIQARPDTVRHTILGFAGKDCPTLSVEWELYNRGDLSRVLCPKSLISVVKQAVEALKANYSYMEHPSNNPIRYLPTVCRIPRIRLLQVDANLWKIIEDCSEYFWKKE